VIVAGMAGMAGDKMLLLSGSRIMQGKRLSSKNTLHKVG